MRKLICEFCGGDEVLKKGELFVCQYCGCQYEDASKILIEIDDSKEVNNLLLLARRARSTNNFQDAKKYYDLLVLKNPNDWEAAFFSVYCDCINCKIAEIKYSANILKNTIGPVFQLIKSYLSDQEQAYSEVIKYTINFAEIMYNTKYSDHQSITEMLMQLANDLFFFFAHNGMALFVLDEMIRLNEQYRKRNNSYLFIDTTFIIKEAIKIDPEIGQFFINKQTYNDKLSQKQRLILQKRIYAPFKKVDETSSDFVYLQNEINSLANVINSSKYVNLYPNLARDTHYKL